MIDKQRHIGEAFPSLIYDGGLTCKVISGKTKADGPTKFSVDQAVFVHCDKTYDILSGRIVTLPTLQTKTYKVLLDDTLTEIKVDPKHIYTKDNVPAPGMPSQTLQFLRPKWLKQGQKVMLLVNEEYKKGYLSINDDGFWEFVLRDHEGNVSERHDIKDIQYSWKMRLQENTFDIGWDDHKATRIIGYGKHVSAANLHHNFAPSNLKSGFCVE